MKWRLPAFACALALGVLLAQTTEPPEYPVGTLCSPRGDVVKGKQTGDHPCHCKNMGDPQTSCEKPTTNDPVCKQWCHEKHCGCPLVCAH